MQSCDQNMVTLATLTSKSEAIYLLKNSVLDDCGYI